MSARRRSARRPRTGRRRLRSFLHRALHPRRFGPRAWAAAAFAVAALLVAGWYVVRPPARALARSVLEERSLERVEALAAPIRRAAAEFSLDPSLIGAIVYVESRGLPDAVSRVGALGLMQLMPPSAADAARALGLPEPSREALLSDVELNLRLGTRHFAWTLQHEERHVERALCAYNAGRTRLRRWLDEHGGYSAWRARQLADGDSQVLAYALKVLELQQRFRERGILVP